MRFSGFDQYSDDYLPSIFDTQQLTDAVRDELLKTVENFSFFNFSKSRKENMLTCLRI